YASPMKATISSPWGRRERANVQSCVDSSNAIPATFESENYRRRRQDIEEEFRERQDKALNEIQRRAQEHSLALIRTPMGLAFAPTRGDEVISPEEFQKLPPPE